ncbi:MAG: MerR family transcriptional regulator [Oscillospiraceae bacterium]|jgi:DNA-binding transcriptional MerR regulator|nr:MerR family transcriptional regulator [Oscillospiraceae bacterium]
MKYKIGDVARILGISADLIRYYEEKGVVSPEKDPENHYRYFDTRDINRLIDCLWYKNYGFGIERIAHMVTEYTYPRLLESIEDKASELRDSIRRQELLLQRVEKFRERLAETRSYVGRCELRSNKPFYYYINRSLGEYDVRSETLDLSRKWLGYMPFTRRYFEVTEGSLTRGENEYVWGFSVGEQYVAEFGIDVTPPVAEMPSALCVHSAFKSAARDRFSARKLDFLLEFATKNGYEPARGAFGNLACSVLEDGGQTGYFEVWLPVREVTKRT